jgi:hypothetical protein
MEELNEERWTYNPSFLVDVASHLHNITKELRGKVKLVIENVRQYLVHEI